MPDLSDVGAADMIDQFLFARLAVDLGLLQRDLVGNLRVAEIIADVERVGEANM